MDIVITSVGTSRTCLNGVFSGKRYRKATQFQSLKMSRSVKKYLSPKLRYREDFDQVFVLSPTSRPSFLDLDPIRSSLSSSSSSPNISC